MLANCGPLNSLKRSSPLALTRFRRLESLLSTTVSSGELYRGESRVAVRNKLANDICSKLEDASPGRLLALLRNALKWEQSEGFLQKTACRVDLITGKAMGPLLDESPATSIIHTLRFPDGSHPECLVFSRDGSNILTGSSDGLIEVWNTAAGTLSMDYEYQAAGNFMVHHSSVTAVALSHDGTLLASGDREGILHLWLLRTGKLVANFKSHHRDAITSLSFSSDDAQVLSSSLDCCVIIYGVKSGRLIQEWRIQDCFAASAEFLHDGDVLTACSDGVLRKFSTSSPNDIFRFSISDVIPKDFSLHSSTEGSVKRVLILDKSKSLVVCPSINIGCTTSFDGRLIRSFRSDSAHDAFVDVAIAPSGCLLYFASERGNLYCFNNLTGDLIHVSHVSDGEITCVSHHPRKSMVAVSSTDGSLRLYSR